MKRVLFLLPLLACAPRLSKEIIKNHPHIKVELVKPQVVEASDPIPPTWTRRLDRGAVDFVPFSGQSSSRTMEAAKRAAEADLLASVSSFVAVDVESEFEAIESEATKDGRTESSVSVRSVVRTKSSAALSSVKSDAVYWEKVLSSPIAPDATSYRVYVHARVPKAEIVRARLKKQALRQKKSGKQTVVVLPFTAALSPPEAQPIAYAFLEEIPRRLGTAATLHVSDPALVASLVKGQNVEAEMRQTVQDALLPDLVISGSYQLHADRVRVTYSIHGADGGVKDSGRVERKLADLFALQDDLVKQLSQKLSVQLTFKPAPTPDPDVYALYQRAADLYRSGKNEASLELLAGVTGKAPDLYEAHRLRGRILDRLGRYGRFVTEPPASLGYDELCVPFSMVSELTPQAFYSVTEATEASVAALKERQYWAHVDHVHSAVDFMMKGGHAPGDVAPLVARSAAGAYFHAYRTAGEDPRRQLEIIVALADLLLRVDRTNAADTLYRQAREQADRTGDLHHASLAHFGLGKLFRVQGRYDRSQQELRRALELRGRLGEKPFLLEIYSELGQLGVETADYLAAGYFYRKAYRIADGLEDEYFAAVLANNLGVLLLQEGWHVDAETHFGQAFDHLAALEESEGQISAGLNVQLSAARHGDLERANAYLDRAEQLVVQTGQAGRSAELYAHRGYTRGLAGEHLAALRDVLRARSIYLGLGRTAKSLRLANASMVAQTEEMAARFPEVSTECLRSRMHELLERGYGADPTRLAPYRSRWWGRHQRRDHRERFYGRPTLDYYLTLLNAEVLARMSGGGW